MKCGLLGRRLGHSYSPLIHAKLGDYPYGLFEKEPEELADFLRFGDFTGLNVTVPYKKAVIPYLDELTPTAMELGAVNTVVRRNGRLIGHNTDRFGFETMLRSAGLNVAGKKTLVLGSGGASNTVTAVLRSFGAQTVVISRSGENNYDNLELHADAALIVNTTPVGMNPDTESAPLLLDPFSCLEGVLDVVYNPARTALLQQAQARGLVTCNGLLMLVAQAKESSEWFQNTKIDSTRIHSIHAALRRQMENILLIGMPGCGKTTVGKAIAELTGHTFADSDALIEEYAGKSIPQIFAEDGEDAFRALETQALRELTKRSGLVIATGGGCVTQPVNHTLLRCSGAVIWLQRDTRKLATDGRPLSQSNSVSTLYKAREPLYRALADHCIDNNGTPASAAGAILQLTEDTL